MKKNKKTAIITGSEGYLGNFFIKELKKKKIHVIKLDKLNKNKLKDYYKVDLNSSEQIINVINKIKKKYKKIDILINAAAQQFFSDFEKRSLAELNSMINTNLKAPILLSQLIYKNYFKKQKHGKIINIASMYGVTVPNFRIYKKNDRKSSETYGATKAGLIHITKYLANYMSKYNVSVNCISPGGILNKQNQSKSFIKKYSNINPSGRLGNASEVANTLGFLLGDKSNYFNGHNFIIDGGHTIKG